MITLDQIHYLIVEDREQSIRNLSQQARLAGLRSENKVGVAKHLEEAMQHLQSRWRTIDAVFLDLNLPEDDSDCHPRKDHGKKLLEFIHNDLNRRSGHNIAVIIVSGEVSSEVENELWTERYQPTVVGIADKGNLTEDFRRCLEALIDDPIRLWLRRTWPDALPCFDDLSDSSKRANDRSLAAITLGCLLLRNVEEYESAATGTEPSRSNHLNSPLRQYLQRNFDPARADRPDQVYSNLRRLRGSPDNWVLRGYVVEQLYSFMKYRNAILHLADTGPFHNGRADYGIWQEYPDVIRRLEDAERICHMIRLVAQDVLEWYLPWHERVFVPWKDTNTAGAER